MRGAKSAWIRHVHLDGKENEQILSCIKRTCRRLKLKEALQDFLLPLK